jgi:hypothetical protein
MDPSLRMFLDFKWENLEEKEVFFKVKVKKNMNVHENYGIVNTVFDDANNVTNV